MAVGVQKDQNRFALLSLLTLNALIYYAIVKTQSSSPDEWAGAISALPSLVPVAAAFGVAAIINSLLGPDTKARLVFWEWGNPLPGARAFTKHLDADARIDRDALLAKFGPFPIDSGDQNRLWYRIYSGVRDDAAVAGASRQYLFARDYAALSFLILSTLGPLSLIQIDRPSLCISVIGVLLGQYLLAARAGRISGTRLVTTAMAVASTKGDTSG